MTDPKAAEPSAPEAKVESPKSGGADTSVTEAAPTEKPAARRRGARRKPAPVPEAAEKGPAPPVAPKGELPKAPRRPRLTAEETRLLRVRRQVRSRRPLFVRQASHRYWRIGRDAAWRRPRGMQSKQRRHYGYRPTVVSIGFRSPRLLRGRTSTGFLPITVRTASDLTRIDPAREAALSARTVGTRRRLLLEEIARKRGVHVLNPLAREGRGA